MSEEFRHHVVHPNQSGSPLLLSNNEVYGLLHVCKAMQVIDVVALVLLTPNAHATERAAVRSAFAQLQDHLEANGWGPLK